MKSGDLSWRHAQLILTSTARKDKSSVCLPVKLRFGDAAVMLQEF